ncbi:MAG: N-acetylneuraminate synthase [Candidatus Cloacimonadota bacterium]|nr:MAG: N-acetylneuraminate synthase [Candidatus Cloacimonadota bacterium]
MKFKEKIKIGSYTIAKNQPVFIIAEAGVNHNGEIAQAKKLIDVAVKAGANAVKFQAFKTENLILTNVQKAQYQKKTTGSDESQFEMLKKLEITKDQNIELINYCTQNNIIFLTTPFDEESLDELDSLNLPAYKVASTDTTNLLFLKKIAQKGKPIFLSTGMSFMSEVELALEQIHKYNKEVILLQCTANYPIKNTDANLNIVKTYQEKFDMLVGYSDHSVGIGASPYAVPMGAVVIEKHFTLDKGLSGPDHEASLSPNELKEFVAEIRKVEKYMGSAIKEPTKDEEKTRISLQKSLVALHTIKQGEVFTEQNIVAKRTGGKGISPINYEQLVGKKATKDYSPNEIIYE